jgi:hypothetical protein
MIKLRNLDDFIEDLSIPGTQSAATHVKTLLIPFSCTLSAIYAKLGTAGVTSAQIVDIMKNGTTIFSSAVKLTFATAVTAATYGPLTTDPPTFIKGDIVRVDVTQVHTTPAVDLNLLLVFTRSIQASGAVQTDTFGKRNE